MDTQFLPILSEFTPVQLIACMFECTIKSASSTTKIQAIHLWCKMNQYDALASSLRRVAAYQGWLQCPDCFPKASPDQQMPIL